MNPSSSHASDDDSGSKGDGEESCYVSYRFWDYFRADVDDGSIIILGGTVQFYFVLTNVCMVVLFCQRRIFRALL